MVRYLKLQIILILIFTPSLGMALPHKAFHEGPYIRIIGGGMTSTFDDHINTGRKIGDDFEGLFGFQFGWNLWDTTAAEFEGRYMTKKIQQSREHLVLLNLNIKYSFITNALTDLGKFHILPYVSGGPGVLLSAIPGDPSSEAGNLMSVWGIGFSGTLGVDFLIMKYLSTGIFFQADVHRLTSGYQTISGVRTKVIAGGWEPTIAVMGAVGVHF